MFESAVDESVLLLMRELFSEKSIRESFYQAGGTGLALLRGHRKSMDIDLFSRREFSLDDAQSWATARAGSISMVDKGTVHALVNNIQVSFLHYPYELVDTEEEWSGVRIAGLKDIGAMKAAAISQRAEKKDFFDMYEILSVVPAEELRDAYVRKYGRDRTNCYHTLRSMFYFDDADSSPDPVSLKGTTWPQVKDWFRNKEKQFTQALLC